MIGKRICLQMISFLFLCDKHLNFYKEKSTNLNPNPRTCKIRFISALINDNSNDCLSISTCHHITRETCQMIIAVNPRGMIGNLQKRGKFRGTDQTVHGSCYT